MNSSPNAGPDVILASASPRRRELLERVGLRLQIAAPEIDETPTAGETAGDYVRRMAANKLAVAVRVRAEDVASAAAGPLPAPLPILAADTIVILRGAILGKPRDEDDARAMLQQLSGHRHEVTTAFRIAFGPRQADRVVTTAVAFRLIDPAELEAYVAGGEWRGKAGGYAVQGTAAAFVTELRGSPTNVIGLPLPEVLADLRALGALPSYPPPRYPTIA